MTAVRLFLIELFLGKWVATQFGEWSDGSWVCVNQHSITGRQVSYFYSPGVLFASFKKINNGLAERKLRAAGLWVDMSKQ